MKLSLPSGAGEVHGAIPGAKRLATLDIGNAPALERLPEYINDALRHPIGISQSVLTGAESWPKVTMVVSDSFRRTGVSEILPTFLDALNNAGVTDARMEFLFATGMHRAPTEAEQREILGESIHRRFHRQCFVHDPHDTENLVQVGETRRGTRVAINRRAYETGCLIATGTVVLHYFGGFGGGRKSIVPGLAAAETIAQNHSLNLHPTEDRLDPAVQIGALAGNPVAEDMLEASRFVPVHCIVNTVLNKEGRIAGLFIGALEAAHEAACRFARELYAVNISEKADLVVAASPGTRNFVQTHKALYNAYQAVKPSGRIVLLAPCVEGLGGEAFVQWLRRGARSDIIAGLRAQSEINGQTALSTNEKGPITLMVTDLSEDDMRLLGARKCPNLQSALDLAVGELNEQGVASPTVYDMPAAAYTVPFPLAPIAPNPA